MAVIGTGKYCSIVASFGYLILEPSIGYYVDNDNRFSIYNMTGTNYWGISMSVNGEQRGYFKSGIFPHDTIKIETIKMGGWTKVVISGAVNQYGTFTEVLSFPIFGMPNNPTWTAEDGNGNPLPYASFTPVTYPAVAPNPNIAAWYTKQSQVAIDGAYRSVEILNPDETTRHFYANDPAHTDADASNLIHVDVTEYFDPTTTALPINSAIFSVHTPFDASTPQATIEAFMQGFAKGVGFEVQGGWAENSNTVIDMESIAWGGWSNGELITIPGALSTTSMGFYFITEAKLNKETWVLEVQGHDGFGVIQDVDYSDFKLVDFNYNLATTYTTGEWFIGELNDFYAMFLEALLASLPTPYYTSGSMKIGTDGSLSRFMFFSPLNGTRSELMKQLTNFCGGRWYLGQDGYKRLFTSDNIAPLTYQISPVMMYGNPVLETYEQPPAPYAITAHNYSVPWGNEATYEVITEVPQLIGLDPNGDPKDATIKHDAAIYKKLYGITSGGTEVEITGVFDPATDYIYKSTIPASAWVVSAGVYYAKLIIKAIKLVDTTSDNASIMGGSVLDNKLVVRLDEQNAVLSWSFPDFQQRAYRFTMRDDPSLKCGNTVQLAVDDTYLNVLLVEAKRTFNGAGRVEYKALYLGDTGMPV